MKQLRFNFVSRQWWVYETTGRGELFYIPEQWVRVRCSYCRHVWTHPYFIDRLADSISLRTEIFEKFQKACKQFLPIMCPACHNTGKLRPEDDWCSSELLNKENFHVR